MEKIELKKLEILSNSDLVLTNGGGLSEMTAKFVDGVGYVIGWISARKITPAHESALLGPNARPTG
ncbi:hypothetical protein [Algoriphagus namhaensis]